MFGRSFEFVDRIYQWAAAIVGILAAAVAIYLMATTLVDHPIFREIASKEFRKFLIMCAAFIAIDGLWYAYRSQRRRFCRRIVRMYLFSSGLLVVLVLCFSADSLLNLDKNGSAIWPIIYAMSAAGVGLNAYLQLAALGFGIIELALPLPRANGKKGRRPKS